MHPSMNARLISVALLLLVLVSVSSANAQTSAKEQARELYGQGNARFDAGDFEGAAQAFKQAYELVQYPIILFNLGLSYEQLGKPVDAVQAFEKVIAAPGKLKPERVEQAKSSLSKQLALVAELSVTCNVEGATIKVDGEEIGAFPLPKPLQVASGRIILMATKDGYQAGYQTVNASGGAKLPVVIQLAEASRPLAQVKVVTTLPGADVFIDQVLVGTTPLAATLPITPDAPHTIELRREGYVTASEKLTLSEGAQGEVTLNPREDRAAVIASGGELALSLVQPDASIFVNGERREVVPGDALRLPAGLHVLRAEREGYDPLRLRVQIPTGGRMEASVDLVPTPATRQGFIDDAEYARGLGWGLTVGGVAFVGAGVGVLAWSLGERAEAGNQFDVVETRPDYLTNKDAYDQERLGYAKTKDNMTLAAVGSGVGAGVGLAGLITGIYFLASGDDPDSFRLKIDDSEFALSPTLEGGPQQGMLGVRGSF